MPPTLHPICHEAYEQAIRVLRACAHPRGFLASARPEGYPQVWARDSVITSLGALLTDDPTARRAVQHSLASLRRAQTRLGAIPNNVDAETGTPNFQAWADSGLWYVIGAGALASTHGPSTAARWYPSVRRVLDWYRHHDVDRTDLITMDEGTDWQDLLAVRGKGLTVNVLHYAAQRTAARLADAAGDATSAGAHRRSAARVRRAVNEAFWYDGDGEVVSRLAFSFGTLRDRAGILDPASARALPEKRILVEERYYLPFLAFRDFGEWYDMLGHALVVLTGLAGRDRARTVLDLARRRSLGTPYPSRALDPPIQPGERWWRDYYHYQGQNLPSQYHNGGVWPFVGGFHVAALVRAGRRDEAAEALESLARANQAGESPWSFHEWLHGTTGAPGGKVEQAWSAGMYVYAYSAVTTGRSAFLGV